MQIMVCERCGEEVEPGDRNAIGLCPDCAEDEELRERRRAAGETDDEDEDDEKTP
jgi:predicted RNA-binding Zn-ribbon protein involved in translation (DUF1610 family)